MSDKPKKDTIEDLLVINSQSDVPHIDQIKQFTGSDKIIARKLYETDETKPQYKIVFNENGLPINF
jgi:phage/plasmid-associated DNA primase